MYRLPREIEGEYACRGGRTSQVDCAWHYYFKAPTNTLLPQLANFADSNLERPSKVGSYQPNNLGIYDMHGNVWEWCEDAYEASNRGRRGGCFRSKVENCQSGSRDDLDPVKNYITAGLRLVLVPAS